MKNLTRWAQRTTIVCSAVLAIGVVPAGARWQQDQSTQTQARDNDLTREEVSTFDRFLDNHPEIERQLEKKPSLVNDAGYLRSQPDLQNYLHAHPRIKAEFQENPNYFMRRENRFEGTEADRDRTRGQNPNPDLNEREVGRMDQFLDEHADLERDLQRNPALLDDSNFLAQHQDLQAFLNAHPRIRAEFDENPSYFMQRENQFEGSAADRDRTRTYPNTTNPSPANNPNPDLNNREVGRMDQFFDDHPDIEKELASNPSLIKDRNYVGQHRDLAVFLSAHPQIREEFAENPQYFMQRQDQFEGSAGDRDHARTNTSRRPPENQPGANPAPTNPNPDLTTQEVSRMDQFLDDHRGIEKQLEKNPSLINDDKYVDHHKDLGRFLDQNPQIREGFAENPNYFMHRENRFEGSAADRDPVRTDRDRDRNVNHDLNDKELKDMHRFLNSHKGIAKDLDKDPSRANDQRYLDHHKDLGKFFDRHEQARTDFAENPQHFMEREHEFERHDDHRLDNHRTDQDKRENKNLDHRADTDHRDQL